MGMDLADSTPARAGEGSDYRISYSRAAEPVKIAGSTPPATGTALCLRSDSQSGSSGENLKVPVHFLSLSGPTFWPAQWPGGNACAAHADSCAPDVPGDFAPQFTKRRRRTLFTSPSIKNTVRVLEPP